MGLHKGALVVFALMWLTYALFAGEPMNCRLQKNSRLLSHSLLVGEMNRADKWWGRDKAQHFAGSLMNTVFWSVLLQHQWQMESGSANTWGAGLTLALGLGKEIKDDHTPGNHFCWKDLTWDVLGIAFGVFLASR